MRLTSFLAIENWERSSEPLTNRVTEQDEVMGEMDRDLASKEEEIARLNLQVQALLQDSQKVKELTKENEDLDEQCERLKIKVRVALKVAPQSFGTFTSILIL